MSDTNFPFSIDRQIEEKGLTFAGLLGHPKRWRESSPSSPVVTKGLGLAAEATQGVLLEAVGVVKGKAIIFLPFD